MPATCREAFEQMPSAFNKEAAKGLNATYQFNLSGEGGGQWNVLIKDEQCEVKEGAHPSPNITISMAAGDYLDMINGKLNGQVAFMTGRLKISGDIGLALKLQGLFKQ
jgi:putative sterol carrier protein